MKKLLLSLGIIVLTSTIISAQTLVGHWPFNGNANDVSGNGLNGTVYGATLTEDQNGTPNSAYTFDGVSSHIDIPYNSLLDVTSWTIQASVSVTSFNPSACQGEYIVTRASQYSNETYLLNLTDNNTLDNNGCNDYTPDSTLFQAGAAGTVANGWNLNNFIILNHWYCVTATYANDTLKLYRDGAITDSMYWPNNYQYGTSQPILGFGYNQGDGEHPYYFNGKIEDVAIWNGALSDSAINATCSAAHETTAVPQISANAVSLTVSPNPATNTLNVQLSNKGNTMLYIINELGQTVLSTNVHSTNNTLDISKLSAGLYFVRTMTENGSVQIVKFVKE